MPQYLADYMPEYLAEYMPEHWIVTGALLGILLLAALSRLVSRSDSSGCAKQPCMSSVKPIAG